jgi:hypothetical protein
MNWYKKISMGLDPNAWQMHDSTHRLSRDQPLVRTPFGTIIQKQRSKEELEKDYAGVHASQSAEMAAVYANGMATPEDPPVVLEIITSQKWEPDIDAQNLYMDYSGWIGYLPYSVEEKLKEEGINEDVIRDIMDDFDNIDTYDENDNANADASDIIFQNNQKKYPSAIIEYYDSQYGDKAEWAFYNTFILPLVYAEGNIDANLDAWMVNQMRFMQEIPDEQVVAIYTFDLFSTEMSQNYEEEERDESGRLKFDYEDLMSGSPRLEQVWAMPKQEALFPGVFDTFYHGTTKTRALKALPSLSNVLQRL